MLDALRFQTPSMAELSALSESGWKKALAFCDGTMLTLPLGLACRSVMPESVRLRIDRNLRNNAARWPLIQSTYREAAAAFDREGLECIVLKGFSHCPDFVRDPRHRPQFDIDLLVRPEQAGRACEIAAQLGYEPLGGFERHPLNHLPTMVRKTGWEWHEDSDPFGVDIPISLEIHFQVWSAQAELFGPEGLDDFWERRQPRVLEGLQFQGLHSADQVANAALHLLRHLLRGSLRPSHVHELAALLNDKAGDATFWGAWSSLHSGSLRRLEAICFALARCWFDCKVPDAASDEMDRLPQEVKRWLELHAWSPLEGIFHANKDELWLHWSLLDSTSARFSVVRRRLLPGRLPAPVSGGFIPDSQVTWRVRLRNGLRYIAYLLSRFRRHLLALLVTAWSAARWFGGGIGLSAQYWRFFFAEGFFDFGMFVFVFLYNLYLLQLGFREGFLGLIAGLTTAGNVAGSLLAVYAMERFGIRNTLLACFTTTAGLCVLRASVVSPAALAILAAAAGIASSAWPVAFAPGVTQLTSERNRSVAFSFICSAGIAIGIAGGLAAGRLPGWLFKLQAAHSSVASYRTSLIVAAAIIALALVPFKRVTFGPAVPAERRIYRPSPFVSRFLIALAAWSIGTGVMNPFVSVYFTRTIQMPVEQIGYVFSVAQAAQVIAVLAAPLAFRRFGLIRGISGMQAATALALLALAAAAAPVWAALGYTAYMMAQYMSEPGMFTLLMGGAAAGERNGASALNFLVSFSGQAIAAGIAGVMLARFGYSPVMVGAALLCVAAAVLFRVLLPTTKPHPASNP